MTAAQPDEPTGETQVDVVVDQPVDHVLALVTALPYLELAAGPTAPLFDGTQVCAQVDPELWFPEKGGSNRAAKALCGVCEFLNPCRRYALTARAVGVPVSGIWGGTSERDRARVRSAVVDHVLDEDLVDHDVAEDVA